jgi:2,4-dienoyl-CoA reductase-like NADH-dependent reductase (Old Yellow Enzyme family)
VHQGRQATVLSTRHPVAPSALPPVRGNRLFGSSRALRADEIVDLVERFAAAAALLERAGFDGVELHAAHGYLIGQFLSPATNLRTDEWGGDLAGRSRFLLEIVRRVRDRVGAGFAVAVKINASDFQPGGFDVEDSAHVVGLLGAEGVDLIEVSGGTYESRSGALGVRDDEPGTARDAYFAGFAPRLRQVTDVPLALTGGLRSREVMERLLGEGVVDVIGLGRPLVETPEAPAGLLAGTLDRLEVVGPRSAAAQDQLLWYMAQFQRLGNGQDFDPDLSQASLYQHLARNTLEQLLVTGQHALGGLVGRTGVPRLLGLTR